MNNQDTKFINDNIHIRLHEARAERLDVWHYQNLRRAYWRLYGNDEDGASLTIDSKPFPLKANALYFIPAGLNYNSYNDSADDHRIRHCYFHFDLLGMPRPVLRELFSGPVCVPSIPALNMEFDGIASVLMQHKPASIELRCRIKAIIYAALGYYMKSVPTNQLERCEQFILAEEPVRLALQYIEDNLMEDLSNKVLASCCSMTVNHFIQRFRYCIGQTPAQYVQEKRVLFAAQRLLFTDNSIEQISVSAGFGNRFYFSRVFSQHFGLPPASYRQSLRKHN